MIAALRAANLPVSAGGRGMIYNASVADLIRMLSLVKTYAEQTQGAVEPEQGAAGGLPAPLLPLVCSDCPA